MPTRRELLISLAAAPFPVAIPIREKSAYLPVEVWQEHHSLSRESAKGFQQLLRCEQNVFSRIHNGAEKRSVMIAAGVRHMSIERCKELLRQVEQGGWLILETGVCFSSAEDASQQASVLERVFNIKVLPQMAIAPKCVDGGFYVAYTWPAPSLIRTFEAVTPICEKENEAIAFFQCRPVCLKRTVDKGGIVYLGTMLGPALYAGEREAHVTGRAIIRCLQQSG